MSSQERASLRGLTARGAALVVLLSAVAGTTLGVLVVPSAPEAQADEGPAPTVDYLGAKLPLDQGALDEAKLRTRALLRRSFALRIDGEHFESFSLGDLGATINEERLKTLIQDARDPQSPLRRRWRDISTGASEVTRSETGEDESHRLVVPIVLGEAETVSHLIGLKDQVDRQASDARIDLRNKSVVSHVSGRRLDVDQTLQAMAQALEAGEARADAVFVTEEPQRRTEQLKGLSFEHVLGHFETRYNRSRKYHDRTFNLRLAASKLDGTVLLPGETFDFNGVVGPRDEANGYKVATVIANGELVDGIGGGTCQISGTLHGAAFFGGLEIVERYPHTRPSSYIKMGMDATVVYPTINFRVRNSYNFPVVLHQTVKDGVVRAEVLGPRQDQVVTLIRKVDEAIPYEEVERPDHRLPRGKRVLAQRGIPGFRLHRYRIVRSGSHTLRERWRDIYPPTAQVVRVGTGGGDAKGNTHSVGTPEYLADELLVLTLKRPRDTEAGEYAEKREQGKYGKRGWTQEAGMPFWQD